MFTALELFSSAVFLSQLIQSLILFFVLLLRASGLRLVPVPVHLTIPVLPLALGLVGLLTLSDAF